MSLKRRPSHSPSPQERKRQHIESTPLPKQQLKLLPQTPSSAYSYPYTPTSAARYPPRPIDSPSNPVGRTRALALTNTLPEITSFSKHLPLRFQYFRLGASRDREGVHRIVQVPLNYTFQHLRPLIYFLFGGTEETDDNTFDTSNVGYLFQIKNYVRRTENSTFLGIAKDGRLRAQLSSTQNPYLYKEEWDFDDEDEDPPKFSDDAEWRWEAEEDVTLGNVFDDYVDNSNAIIFNHFSTIKAFKAIQIHITVARETLEKRSGRGNVPWIFRARGRVYMFPPKRICQGNLGDGDGDDDPEYGVSYLPHENFKALLPRVYFNDPPDLFIRYFERHSVAPIVGDGFLSQESEQPSVSSFPPTPGLTMSSSPARPMTSSSPWPDLYTYSPIPYKAPKITPGPRPANRKRLDYIRRRIERSKRRAQDDYCPDGKGEDEDEIDQLRSSQETEDTKPLQEVVLVYNSDDDEENPFR